MLDVWILTKCIITVCRSAASCLFGQLYKLLAFCVMQLCCWLFVQSCRDTWKEEGVIIFHISCSFLIQDLFFVWFLENPGKEMYIHHESGYLGEIPIMSYHNVLTLKLLFWWSICILLSIIMLFLSLCIFLCLALLMKGLHFQLVLQLKDTYSWY